jgi:hypothetical protein
MNRDFMGLSALLLSITGVTVRAIPPTPPEDVRIVRVLVALGSTFVARVRKGTVLKNLGCELHNGDRWCRVQLRDDPRVEGWARAQYLREFNR